jgi:hypothetical protein
MLKQLGFYIIVSIVRIGSSSGAQSESCPCDQAAYLLTEKC